MQRFELLGRNGSGANSTVFRCRDNVSGGIVAVKKVEGATLPQVLQEAAIMRVCAHKHCVSLLEAHQGLASGVTYLVMEHVEHSLSREILLNPWGLPLLSVKRVAFQLAMALETVHGKKVVHGDLKPANVLLTGQNDVKLCDFGSATSTFLGHRFGEAAATEGVHGAPGISPAPSPFADMSQPMPKVTAAASRWYCAPESLLGSESSAASDIWAFGCIIAELVTGKPLMPGGENELDQLCCVVAVVGSLSEAQEQLLQLLPREQQTKINGARARGPLLHRIPKVAACSALAEVLTACLQADPARRPTVQEIQAMPFFEDLHRTQGVSMEQADAFRAVPGAEEAKISAKEAVGVEPTVSDSVGADSYSSSFRRVSSGGMEVDSTAVGAGLSPDGTGPCGGGAACDGGSGPALAPAGSAGASGPTTQPARRLCGVQPAAPVRPIPRARVSALTATIRGNPFEGDGSYVNLMPQVLRLVAKWDEAQEREAMGPIALAARSSCTISPAQSMTLAASGELPILGPRLTSGAISTSLVAAAAAASGMPDTKVSICTTPIAAAAGGCGAVRSTVLKLPPAVAAPGVANPMDSVLPTQAEPSGSASTPVAATNTLSASVGAMSYMVKAAGMGTSSTASGLGGPTITPATCATSIVDIAGTMPTPAQLRSRATVTRARRHQSRESCVESVPTDLLESSTQYFGLGSSVALMQRGLMADFSATHPTELRRPAGHTARRSFADLSDLASVAECEALRCETPPDMKRRRGLLRHESFLPGGCSQLSAGSTSSLATEASLGSIQQYEPTLFGRGASSLGAGRRMRRSSSGTGLVTGSPVRHAGGWRQLLPVGAREASQPQPITARSRYAAVSAAVKAHGLAASVSSDIHNSAASDAYLGEAV